MIDTIKSNHLSVAEKNDNFNDVFNTFVGLELVSCVAVYAGSESSRISSEIS